MLAIYRNPQGTYTKNIAGYANPSKEDEEKNKRLVAENNSIKQEIAKVSWTDIIQFQWTTKVLFKDF